ncbi:MAG: hypothetical protein JWO06_1329 [Bacteroidota bacterium]|nr:hypothetical protein [Bacteroidota bacterium]
MCGKIKAKHKGGKAFFRLLFYWTDRWNKMR